MPGERCENRRKRGVCISCGVNPPRKGKLECQDCADKRAVKDKAKYAAKQDNVESINDGKYCELTAWMALKQVVMCENGWFDHIVGDQTLESWNDLHYKKQSSDVLRFLKMHGGESSCHNLCKNLKMGCTTVTRLAQRMWADGMIDWKRICNGRGKKQLFLIAEQ